MVAVHPVPGSGAAGVSVRPSLRAALAAAVVVALLAPFLSLIGAPAFWRGEFVDADCFMRLERVLELMQGGSWYESVSPRTDAPSGEDLHWTRPFDVLIWLGAWPLSVILGLKPALEWWGTLVSPLLLLPTLLVLQWGMAPLFGRRAIWGAVPFFLVQPQLLWVYIAGRPDHHSLLAVCAAVVFAAAARLAIGTATVRAAAWAGAAAGLGVWVSVEGLVVAVLGAGLLALDWLSRGGASRVGVIRAYLFGFAGMLALALVIEYPPTAWAEVRYVKLSVVHVLLAGAAAAAWAGIARLADGRDSTVARRLGWCVLGAAVPAVVIGLVFPQFFHGPLVLHSAEAQAWSPTVGEMSPLLPVDRDMTMAMLAQLGLPLVACGFLLVLSRRWRDRDDRALAWALLLPTLAFTLIGLMQNRWSSYAQLAAVLPLLMAGQALWRWPAALRLGATVLPWRGPALAGLYTLPLLVMLAMFAVFPAPAEDSPRAQGSCRWPELADLLRRDRPAAPEADILFTHMFPGPEMMWRSGYRVVAAPYISNTGIVDSIRVFGATDDASAHAILTRRRAALVLVCGHDGEAREYRGDKNEYHPIVGLPPATPNRSLHARLLRGDAPPWLTPLPLPAGFEGVRLYRMR